MPTRGRLPRFLGLFILAVSFIGVISFQIFKERRIASAAITEKDFQLQEIEHSLQEQTRVASQREEERNFAQTKLVELERLSQTALESLRAKERELDSIKIEHQRTVDDLKFLKKVVEQKEGEIVDVRGKLQVFSFEKAKESAQQFSSEKQREEIESRQAEEHKPADEAGIVDRKRTQELEELHTNEIEAVAATEKEMIERSNPKANAHTISEKLKSVVEDTSNFGDASKLEVTDEEEAEEHDNVDTRDPDEKDIDAASQEVDLNEVINSDADHHNGEYEDAGSQQHADHDTE